MGYAIDWSDLEQRIQDQKAALLDTSQNMDPERLKFLVETYDECKGESVFITRAKLFEKVLNNKKIYLDGNPIVGSLDGGRAMIYAYPEWQCNWVKDDLDSEKLALSSLGEVRFSDETKEILKRSTKRGRARPRTTAPTSSTRAVRRQRGTARVRLDLSGERQLHGFRRGRLSGHAHQGIEGSRRGRSRVQGPP
ncbi:MAG: pyruvate formate lyase family protein [Bilophila wadsworthia]